MIVLTVRTLLKPGDRLVAGRRVLVVLLLGDGVSGLLDGRHVLGDDDVDVIASLEKEVQAGDAIDLEGDRLFAGL